MTKFTICKNIISEVQEQYEETFDIGDQALWLSLRKNASSYLSKAEIKKIPEKASDNLEHWLLLYKHLPSDKFELQNESLSGVKNTQWVLTNCEDDESDVDAPSIHMFIDE